MRFTWYVPPHHRRNVRVLYEQYKRLTNKSKSSFCTEMWDAYITQYNDHRSNGEKETDRYYMLQEMFRDFLARHESDIANDINDFGDLKLPFKTIIGYEAEP